MQGVDTSAVTCCVRVCTVTDFSAEHKASSVTFCTAIHRSPRQGISYFGELCSPESQNRTNRPARVNVAHRWPVITAEMRRPKRHARNAPFVKSRGVWT